MNFNIYQKKARGTALYPEDHALSYVTLGLFNEIMELYEKCEEGLEPHKEIIGEIGDVCWYISNLTSELSLQLFDVIEDMTFPVKEFMGKNFNQLVIDLMKHSGVIAGIVKKVLRDKDGYVDKQAEDRISSRLRIMIALIDILCTRLETTIYNVFDSNIEKLYDRKERNMLKREGDNR